MSSGTTKPRWHGAPPSIMYGTAWKKEKTEEYVTLAIGAGFLAIDTANQPKHYQEPLVGAALKKAFEGGRKRTEFFIQTKFTPIGGQDQRLPYDPKMTITEQVKASCASSLRNLHTDYIDSYLLHGPYHFPHLGDEDFEAWRAIEELFQHGQTRAIGISNVTAGQLDLLCRTAKIKPMVVQNRCYANRLWDREVRNLCREFGILYQGFSLLTANPQVVHHPLTQRIAHQFGKTPEQIVLRFAQQTGMLPLSGTTDRQHMKDDIGLAAFTLEQADLNVIEELGLR